MRAILLFGLMVLSAQTSMANTFSMDNRKVLAEDNPAPWRSVGVLYRPENKYCTAFLVGPDLLATSASCVADANNDVVKGTYTFKPGDRKGKAKYSAKAIKMWHGDSRDSGQDWAILRLDWKVGEKLGWFGATEYDLEDMLRLEPHHTIYMAGYSHDMGKGRYPLWQKDCGPKNVLDKTILHDCSAVAGAAGSPIFIFNKVDDTVIGQVIGIHVGERRNGSKSSLMGVPYSPDVANAAVPASAFIDKLRELRQD